MSDATKNPVINKYKYESFMIGWDFTNDLDSGETPVLVTSIVTATNSAGTDVSSTILDSITKTVTGNKLLIACQAGSRDFSPYEIVFKCVTTSGNQFEGIVTLNVLD